MKRFFIIAGTLALLACGKSSTGLANANVTGTWSGPVSDALLGSGTLSLALTQTADSVVGTWSTSFANPASGLIGTLAGNVAGSTLKVFLKPNDPPTCQFGPFEMTASVNGNTGMSGMLATIPCPIADSASFAIVKQ